MAKRGDRVDPVETLGFDPGTILASDGYKAKYGKAPTDAMAEAAWDQIMKIAKANALIVQAYGGVATLAVPSEQRKAGIREQTLRMELFELEGRQTK